MRHALVVLALVATPALADTETLGAWTTTTESSNGALTLVTALAVAPGASQDDPAFVSVRCLGGRTEVLVGTAGDWGLPRSRLEVTTRAGSASAETSQWDVSTNGKAVFIGEGAEDFLRRLPTEGRLSIEVRDRQGQAHANAFPLDGVGEVRSRVAQACGWKP